MKGFKEPSAGSAFFGVDDDEAIKCIGCEEFFCYEDIDEDSGLCPECHEEKKRTKKNERVLLPFNRSHTIVRGSKLDDVLA